MGVTPAPPPDGPAASRGVPASDIRRFVAAMPKVELHVHLVGAIEVGDDERRFESFASFAAAYRYVDGLRTWAPDAPEEYVETGRRLAAEGYVAAGAQIAG